MKYHLTEVLEQPEGGFPALNDSPRLTLWLWRYVTDVTQTYVNKQRFRLTLTQLHPNVRPRSRDSLMFFHREMNCNKNDCFIVDDYSENVNIFE